MATDAVDVGVDTGAMDVMPVDALLEPLPPDKREIAEALRAIVRRVVPDAIEAVRPGWRVVNYRIPLDRKRAPVFGFVMVEPVHVHLGFEHGVLMDDPDGSLEGTFLRRARYVTLSRMEDLDPPALERLVREAVRIASMSSGERMALRHDLEIRRQARDAAVPDTV